MTTTTTLDARKSALATLAFARRITNRLVEATPEDSMTHQPYTGANHVLWNIGHLAWTDDYFLSTLGARSSGIPEKWSTLFGMGSEPVDDPSRYPSLAEVKAAYTERRRVLTKWFEDMSEAKLAEPLPEKLQGFAENFVTMIGTIAAHECMHNGQIACMRKAQGLEAVLA